MKAKLSWLETVLLTAPFAVLAINSSTIGSFAMAAVFAASCRR